MQKLAAKSAFRYAGRKLHAGDRFDADDKHATALVMIGKAEPAETPPFVPVAVVEEPVKPQKRTYKRRDMRAE